jgi:hypothetical protein
VALLEGDRSPTFDLVRQQLGSSLEDWLGWLRSRPLLPPNCRPLGVCGAPPERAK